MKSFQKYMDELGATPAYDLKTREDVASRILKTSLIPEGLRDEYLRFRSEWEERFGIKNTIHGITIPGWYNLTVKACDGMHKTYPDRLQTIVNVWGPQRVDSIRAHWEKIFSGHGEEALVVAKISVDKRFGPWIEEASKPMPSTPLTLVHHHTGISWWTLSDADGDFRIEIPGPGSIPFQRAAKLIESCYSSAGYNTPIMLEWIFATGYDNALMAADAALSGRSSETMSTARRKVRAAIA